ncbi:MAG: zinc carboxypeptidase, partial [Clostridia bacterium]|nr:zinc carboxypeptidase [Clostridia bacterium]
STGEFEDKPVFCVTGNIHAGEVTGSMCAMYLLDYLFTNLEDAQVQTILKNFTVYCVPRISPDGSEYYLTTPNMIRSVPKMHPFPDPLPGLHAEDIDGDGVIRLMRVKSKTGLWKVSEKDPRVMTKRRPDDMEGTFYNVYDEGKILEFDGADIQPAPGVFGNDLNRNFPVNWLPEHQQAGSGAYALSNDESRIMAEFINAQKNLCAILNFHTMGGMYLYPPGMKGSKLAAKEDMLRYDEIGRMAVEETTFPCVNIKDDYVGLADMSVVGAFDDFNYFAQGLVNYTCECWDLDPRAGFPHPWPRPERVADETEEAIAAARLKWLDENNNGEGHMNWTAFDHPQLGEMEIGGLDVKAVVQNCPIKFLPEECEKHTRFMLRFIKTLPRLLLDDVKVTALGGDNHKVEAVVQNMGYLPTYITKEGLDTRKSRPLTAVVSGEGVEVVEGKAKTEIGHLQGFSGVRAATIHTGPVTVKHEPFAKKLSWVVKGAAGTEVTLTVSAPRAGRAVAKVTL